MMAQAGSSAMTGAIDLAWAWRALAAMALVRDEGSPRDRDLELIEAIRSGDKRASVLLFDPDGVLRFSPHFHNHADEVPKVAAAVREALAAVG